VAGVFPIAGSIVTVREPSVGDPHGVAGAFWQSTEMA
jgi:hypothetical protein